MAAMAPATVQPSLSSASPLWGKGVGALGEETIKTKGDSTVTSDLKPLQNDRCEELADSPHWAFARSVCRNTGHLHTQFAGTQTGGDLCVPLAEG